MEAYLKSWKTSAKMVGRDYHNYLQSNPADFKMKNSFKMGYENKEKVEGSESSPDSLPIHCIVQTISSVEDFKAFNCPICDGKSKMEAEGWWECECKKNEMSGCVVVPEDTSMSDLVKTVLMKLGYPSCASSFAAGSILIRNWKPLPLEIVCPGMKKTVAEILGELTAVVSLRILFFWPKITTLQKIKDNLLQFLIRTNQNFLRDSGCPFDTSTLSEFCDPNDHMRKHLFQEPSQDLQRKFDAWLKHHEEIQKESDTDKTQPQSTSYLPNDNKTASPIINGDGKTLRPSTQKPDSVRAETGGKYIKESPEEENVNSIKESPSFSVMERPKNFPTPKTRVRTSFDPEFELPKLHKWYLENPHPSRQQIYEYVAELNSLESRKGRKQLDVNNVVYWFKNARAAQKRTECRKLSNMSTSGTNRCNVLKIPLGKSSGVTSDDQRSISDDEASVTSESGDDYQNENGRCLQVVGKWNSNGQGEAVLEMQIAARKNEFVRSIIQAKKEQMNEDEEITRSEMLSTDEDSVDPLRRGSTDEKKDSPPKPPEENSIQKENQAVNVMENNKNEIRNSDAGETDQRQSNGDMKEDEVSPSKAQIRSSFTPYKENNGVNSSAFLSPYKSGFPVPPNAILGHSFICMSPYMNPKPNNLPLSSEERRKRNRTFIDPVTEVPRLEQWFRLSTHPSHNLIARYTEELNNMPYRRKFPKLEAKNVQFWFKNRRAKNKRLNYLETKNN